MAVSPVARSRRATVLLSAFLVLVPLVQAGDGPVPADDAACEAALERAASAIGAARNLTALDALVLLNEAGPACRFDIFEGATPAAPTPPRHGTSVCPMTGGVGSTSLVIDVAGVNQTFRDVAFGPMAEGHIETDGTYLGMRATGNTGHVRVGALVIPALDGANADVVCGEASGKVCVKFFWVFEKCADAGVAMACSGTGEAYILDRKAVRVYGYGALKAPAPCTPKGGDLDVHVPIDAHVPQKA